MQDAPATKRAALYLRLSEDRDQSRDNVADQEAKGRALATRLGARVVKVYDDNDHVASEPKRKPRPAFEEMLVDATNQEFDLLVCRHADRLYRTPYDQQRIAEVFEASRIVIHQEWVGYPIDLSTPTGVLNAGLMAQVAQYETAHKRMRQKAKNRMVAESGRPPEGGPIPYGYREDRLALHPEHAAVVRGSYEAILRGASLGSVLRKLNERSVPAPRGGRWTYSNLRSVLLRPLNAGLVQYNGVILTGVVGSWQPLVGEEDYYAMKALLADPSRRTTSGNTRRHLLAGIVRCGNCDSPLKSGAVGSRSGKVAPLYRCTSPLCTKRVNVARNPLETHVIDRLLRERGNLPVITTRPRVELGEALARVEHSIRGVTSRLAEDDADDDALMARLKELRTERTALSHEPRGPAWGLRTVAAEWDDAPDLDSRRNTLLGHLDRLTIASRGKTSHRFDPGRVTLTWRRFEGATVPGTDEVLLAQVQGALPQSGFVGGLIVRQSDGTVILSSPSPSQPAL